MTPNTSDLFTRVFVDAFKETEIIGVPTGFQAFFGDPANGSRTIVTNDSEAVDIDIMRANGRRLAATVNRGTSTDDVTRQKNALAENFSNFSRKFPLIEEEGNINNNQLLKRVAGENPFSGSTREERARIYARDILGDQVRKSVRTFEYFASQSVLTGQHPAIIDTTNADLIYDFRRDPLNFITVGTAWNGVLPDILGDIDAACERLELASFMEPNFIGIGDDAMADFIADTGVQSNADNRRFELIEVSTNNPVPPEYARFIEAGWIARGRLRTPKGRVLWIFNYNKRYTNSAGSTVRYLPSDKAFICDINARADRYFGPPDRLPVTPDEAAWIMDLFGINIMAPALPAGITAAVLDAAMFHFDAYRSPDKKTVIMRAQSAPIYPTTQTDAFVTLQGLHV